jgi:hypothetical protein
VAYLRFHGPQNTATGLGADFGEDLSKALQLGLIAQDGSRAVGLDQLYLARRNASLPVHPAHRLYLALYPRCGQKFSVSVRSAPGIPLWAGTHPTLDGVVSG